MPVKNKNKMKKLILLSVFAFAAVFACGQAVAATITGKTFINANYTGVKTIKVSQTVLDVNIVKSSGSKTGVKCYVEKMIVNVPITRKSTVGRIDSGDIPGTEKQSFVQGNERLYKHKRSSGRQRHYR